MDHESDRNLDNGATAGATMGLQLTPDWRVMLSYHYQETDDTRPGGEEDIEWRSYQLEAHRTFLRRGRFEPYVLGSFGEIEIDGQNLDNRGRHKRDTLTIAQAGLGLGVNLTPKWSVRVDWRYTYSFDEGSTGNHVGATLAYRFGRGNAIWASDDG